MRWCCRHVEFVFPRPALVMGIVNVTPDSFSDGGLYFEPDKAVARGCQLVADGADLLDIGGESTRPNAAPVSEAEELRRVIPVVRKLARVVSVPLSVDTRKPVVALAALEAGASVINDVEANRTDELLWQVVADAKAGYVCMHMQGTPATMQVNPHYSDVVREVGEFFADRLRRLAQCGVDREQVALDVGIGFGKGLDHNLDLLAGLESYRGFDRPLVLGVSRKSFLGRLLGLDVGERLPGAIACTTWAARAGVQVFRTHDVAATRQALRLMETLLERAAKGK